MFLDDPGIEKIMTFWFESDKHEHVDEWEVHQDKRLRKRWNASIYKKHCPKTKKCLKGLKSESLKSLSIFGEFYRKNSDEGIMSDWEISWKNALRLFESLTKRKIIDIPKTSYAANRCGVQEVFSSEHLPCFKQVRAWLEKNLLML